VKSLLVSTVVGLSAILGCDSSESEDGGTFAAPACLNESAGTCTKFTGPSSGELNKCSSSVFKAADDCPTQNAKASCVVTQSDGKEFTIFYQTSSPAELADLRSDCNLQEQNGNVSASFTEL
jgi:hypothetical protein